MDNNFVGVGGGMTLKTETSHVFNLTVLYSAPKKEREQHTDQDRMRWNKLVKESKNGGGEKYELLPAVRDLCQTLDGFVYVVDSSVDSPAGDYYHFNPLFSGNPKRCT